MWLLVGGLVSAAPSLRAQTVVFVDGDATGPTHDGTSWCTAFTDLQGVLSAATAGTEIRVAAGTYKPTTGVNRTSTFQLKTGVAVLGGFAGCGEVDPDLRDLSIYESVLSGDLGGDDVEVPESSCCREHLGNGCDQNSCEQAVCTERATCCTDQWDRLCAALAAIQCCTECGSRCENAYHVVSVVNPVGTDDTAVLDGFTITGGFANGNNPSDRGAGIFSSFSFQVPSRPTINNCRIHGNVAQSKGAGIANEFSEATFTNCAIYGNIARMRGAGVYNFTGSSPSFVNCTVVGNTAQNTAGGMWVDVAGEQSVTIVNTILWNNADDGGQDQSAQLSIASGLLFVSHATVQGWTGSFGGTANNGLDPLFAGAAGPDGLLGTSDDDFSLTSGSPAINTSDPATEVADGAVDLNGQPRLVSCRLDRGALESERIQAEFDFDADNAVTLADFAHLQVCFEATWIEPGRVATCLCVFDADESGAIDLDDFAAFAAALIGP